MTKPFALSNNLATLTRRRRNAASVREALPTHSPRVGATEWWSPALDQCLRAGMAHGRRGVRRATDRVLAMCPALTRAHCWQRLRWLREHACRERPSPGAWPADLIERLREGYRQGGAYKRAAFRAARARYPGLPGHVIVRFARQQGWLSAFTTNPSPRRCWTAAEQARFAAMAEHQSVAQIAQLLSRSTKAIRWRLGAQSLSAKVEGIWSLRQLTDTFQVGKTTLRRWIAEHDLRVRDTHITGASLLVYLARGSDANELVVQGSATLSAIQPDHCYCWKNAAQLLGRRIDVVRQGVANGVLKLVDARVSDHALESFCQHRAVGRLHCARIDPAVYRWLVCEYHLPPYHPSNHKVSSCPALSV